MGMGTGLIEAPNPLSAWAPVNFEQPNPYLGYHYTLCVDMCHAWPYP